MRYSTLLFFIVLSICSCKQPETNKPFPFPYKWTDSVLDYSINHNELTLRFPNHTTAKHWLFEVYIYPDSSDQYADSIHPTIFPVVNNEVHIPLQINDSIKLDQLRYTLFGEPWDCQLFGRQNNGKFFNQGRVLYLLHDGAFHVGNAVVNNDWYIAPDSLTYDSTNYYYLRKLAKFIQDSTADPYPLH